MTRCTVVRLSTTPVKGLMLHHPDSVELGTAGVAGDREFYLVSRSGRVESCTHHASLYGLTAVLDPGGERLEILRAGRVVVAGTVETSTTFATDMWGLRSVSAAHVADPVWAAFFSDLVSKPVSLARAIGSAFDVAPVTLLGTGSVDELARRSGVDELDGRRFRMLIEFSGGDPHVEDTWQAELVSVGSSVIRIGGPVKRCAATTRHPETGLVDAQTLRHIAEYRGRQDTVLGVGATFGVYAEVVQPGLVTVGDSLVL